MIHTERPRLTPMRRLDLWRWRYFDSARKEWTVTSFVMDEAESKQQFPQGAERVESSLQTRWIPDDGLSVNTGSRLTEASPEADRHLTQSSLRVGMHKTTASKRASLTGQPGRFNHFVLREEAVARDDLCVKALEEVLAQREEALIQARQIDGAAKA